MEAQTESKKITKDIIIGDIVSKYPQVIDTLYGYGVHCVGCHVSAYETIEQGFRAHGMSDEQIEKAIDHLNEVLEKDQAVPEDQRIKQPELVLTDKAAEKLKELLVQEKKQGLRISVMKGGCSGSSYGMELDDQQESDAYVFDVKGVKIFVANDSMDKLNGCTVDYLDTLQGAGFKISNPNATSTCGCGSSFR